MHPRGCWLIHVINRQEFISQARQLIGFDTSPSGGTREACQFLADLCRAHGMHVETMDETWADQPQMNLIARPMAGRPPQELLLLTHLDTVEPGPFGLWSQTQQNPFDAHIIENKIYGLGSAEVKLDFLCKLEALKHFPSDTEWKLPPVLVGTYGEEIGMSGCLKLIRKAKVSSKWALVSEPSNLRLITAGKGLATVEMSIPFSPEEKDYREQHNLHESSETQSRTFNGRPAHSSTPQLGESAIKKMFEFLLQLPTGVVVMEVDGGINPNTVPSHAYLEMDYFYGNFESMVNKLSKVYQYLRNLESEFLQHEDTDFSPAHPTLNIGTVRTLENYVLIAGNCRIPPLVSHETYEKWMQQLSKVCEGVGGQLRVTDYKRPFTTPMNSVFTKGCQSLLSEMSLDPEPMSLASTSEASLLSRVGIECLCFGPGVREGNIHTPNEHVEIESLEKAVEYYIKVIKRFCL